MPYRYPIFLDLSGRSILIVGGGRIALRKAQGLIEGGADQIKCVAPRIDPEMPPAVQKIIDQYRSEHLNNMDLVIASTDSTQVNNQVIQDARRQKIWACRIDTDPDQPGDFITPARFHRGPITVAVSAAGASVSAALRDHLSSCMEEKWVKLAEAMQLLRPRLLQCTTLTPGRRSGALRDLASQEALQVLDNQGFSSLESWLKARYPEFNGS